MISIRLAISADADAIRSVYADYISTPITFEYELPTREEFQARVDGILEFYPYLVAEQNGEIIGYAYAHRQAERFAFSWNAELSIYLAPKAKGHGLGTVLYQALIEFVRMQNVHTAYALITTNNPASEKLHEKLGFRLEWVQPQAGWKDGEWHGVSWYLLDLIPCDGDPGALVAFTELPSESVEAVLSEANEAIRQ